MFIYQCEENYTVVHSEIMLIKHFFHFMFLWLEDLLNERKGEEEEEEEEKEFYRHHKMYILLWYTRPGYANQAFFPSVYVMHIKHFSLSCMCGLRATRKKNVNKKKKEKKKSRRKSYAPLLTNG